MNIDDGARPWLQDEEALRYYKNNYHINWDDPEFEPRVQTQK